MNATPKLLERIITLDRLSALAEEHKAVFTRYGGSFQKPKPAAFVINMTGYVILRLFHIGLYVYDKDFLDAERKEELMFKRDATLTLLNAEVA